MAAPDTSQDGVRSTTSAEHNSAGKAKRIQVRGIQPSDGEYYNVSVRVAGSNPALNVAIVDGDGNQVASFGGGTQYTDGNATPANPVGTMPVFDDGGTITAVSDLNPLPVLASIDTTGLATSAKQDTLIGHLDGVEALLGTIDTDTGNIDTSLNSIEAGYAAEGAALGSGVLLQGDDGTDRKNINVDATTGDVQVDVTNTVTVDGSGVTQPVSHAALAELAAAIDTEVQVDIVGALPSGNNNIGDVDIASIAAGDNNIGNVDIVTLPGDVEADIDQIRDQIDLITPDIEEIRVDADAIRVATELIDDAVYVDDADWTADTSKHMLVGGVTQVATTANTDGDVTPLTTNAMRELRTAIPESDLATAGTSHVKKYYTNAGAVTDGIIWSPAAGKRWYVTDISINVSAAATVTLEDDLAGGDSAVWKAELAANGGWSHSFATPLFSGEDAADLIVTTSAGNVYITVTGYEI